MTTARLTPRTRSADTATSSPSTVATAHSDQRREWELDAAVVGHVRDGVAGDAGERDLDDGDLADEAGDDDVGEADQRGEERDDQRLAEVPREEDQGPTRTSRSDGPRCGETGLGRGTNGRRFSISSPRPGRLAPRQNIASTMTRKTNRSQRRASRCRGRRKPRLRRDVVQEHRLGHAEQEPDAAGDAERREPREQGGGERGHDVGAAASAGIEHGDRCRRARRGLPETRQASTVLTIDRLFGDSPASVAETSSSDAARGGKPESAPAVEGREHGRGRDHDSRHPNAVEPTTRPQSFTWMVLRQHRRLRLRGVSERHQHRRLRVRRTPSEAASFASGAPAWSGLKASSSIDAPKQDDDGERDDERGRGRDAGPEQACPQCPVRVAGEHGDATGGEIDHARPAVEDDDSEGDPGDQRPDAQAEQGEEENLLNLVVLTSVPYVHRAGPACRPGPLASTANGRASAVRRGLEPARDSLELEPALVLEELRLVVAVPRVSRVLAALHGRGAQRHRAAERLRLLGNRRRRDVLVADLVQPLDQRQRLPERDGSPWVGCDLRRPSYFLKTLMKGGTPLSVRSKPSEDAIANVHFG